MEIIKKVVYDFDRKDMVFQNKKQIIIQKNNNNKTQNANQSIA